MAALSTVILFAVACSSGGDDPTQGTAADQVAGATGAPAGDAPVPRFYGSMVDVPGAGVLFVGGEVGGPPGEILSDLWSFDPANGWIHRASETPGQPSDAMAFDAASGMVAVVNDVGEAWSYDPASGTWEALATNRGPRHTWGARAAYDAGSDRIILFGGFDGTVKNDQTWALDVDEARWERMRPEISPPAQDFHAMAYDPHTDRVVLQSAEAPAHTWTYDYEADAWTEVAGVGPESRLYASMAYDPANRRMILFGGRGASGNTLEDTWTYDVQADAWAQLELDPSPGPRAWQAMAFDDESGMILLFGGGPTRESEPELGVWSFDPTTDTWSLL